MPPPLALDLLRDPPPLRSARLCLRPLHERDAAGLLALRGDPEVMRFMGAAPLPDLATAAALVEAWLAQQHRREGATWALTFPGADELIGTLSLFKPDPVHRKVEIGYSLLPRHWRRGYTSEAVGTLLTWLYTTFGAHRIVAEIDPNNLASAALLRGLGFRREAYFREAFLVGENYTDSEIYGRLSSDDG